VAPPVPIPNTEVKRCSPNGSASLGCARVGRRQNYEPRPVKAGRGSLVFFNRARSRPSLFEEQANREIPQGLAAQAEEERKERRKEPANHANSREKGTEPSI
jgi:hypothetical protein